MWTIAFLAGLGMVAVTAWLLARRLGAPTVTGVVLTVYLVGFTEVLALTLVLSAVRALRWWTVLVGAGVVLVAVIALVRRVPSEDLTDRRS